MRIKVESETAIRLFGLPQGMYECLDTEQLYSGDEVGNGDRIRDEFGAFVFAKGYDVSIMPDGEMKRFYPGFDMPLPEKPVTDVIARKLRTQFYRKRIVEAARATPEFKWLKKAAFKFKYEYQTYRTDGSILLKFVSEAEALVFKLAMGGAAND